MPSSHGQFEICRYGVSEQYILLSCRESYSSMVGATLAVALAHNGYGRGDREGRPGIWEVE